MAASFVRNSSPSAAEAGRFTAAKKHIASFETIWKTNPHEARIIARKRKLRLGQSDSVEYYHFHCMHSVSGVLTAKGVFGNAGLTDDQLQCPNLNRLVHRHWHSDCAVSVVPLHDHVTALIAGLQEPVEFHDGDNFGAGK